MSSLRFGVAGLKHFHILEFIKGMQALPGSEFVGFFDDDPALQSKYSQEFGVPAFASLEKLVETTRPEIVGVADFNGRKADTICTLANLGCHVLADKPLVTTLAGLDRVEQTAAKTGRKISLMLLERYNAPTRAVRNLLDSGRLGRLASFTGLAPHKLRPAGRPAWVFQPELYGGVLNDLAIHNVDLCRWIWRQDPIAVTAVEGCLRFTEYPGFSDHAEVFLEFTDSSTAMLRADWLTPEAFPSHGDGRQIFEGTAGTVEIRAAPDIHTLGEGEITFDPWDRPRERIAPLPPAATLYAEFVALCRGTRSAELLPEDSFRSTRVTLYARDAARTRQRLDLRERL
jgi:predicted dehydrogenase